MVELGSAQVRFLRGPAYAFCDNGASENGLLRSPCQRSTGVSCVNKTEFWSGPRSQCVVS
jgi:hypothetical protein